MFYLVPAFSNFLRNWFTSGDPIPGTKEELVSVKRALCI